MLIFRGKLSAGTETSSYRIKMDGWPMASEFTLRMCYGDIFGKCGISGCDQLTWTTPVPTTYVFHGINPANGFAWGYDGEGPSMLSVTLLCLATNAHRNLGMVIHLPYVEPTGDESVVIQHHRAFTEQVIANLPDNWTMTDEEIRAWLKDGTLPACITNKPKE